MNRKTTKRELIRVIKEEIEREKLEESSFRNALKMIALTLAMNASRPQTPNEIANQLTPFQQYVEKEAPELDLETEEGQAQLESLYDEFQSKVNPKPKKTKINEPVSTGNPDLDRLADRVGR